MISPLATLKGESGGLPEASPANDALPRLQESFGLQLNDSVSRVDYNLQRERGGQFHGYFTVLYDTKRIISCFLVYFFALVEKVNGTVIITLTNRNMSTPCE